MQRKETTNPDEFADLSACPRAGRLIALDPGMKRVGVAVTDETQTLARPLMLIERTSWKKLLLAAQSILSEFDAKALVIGLPLNFDGGESEMSAEARKLARNFSLSLSIPVYLQDERATSYEAKGRLWDAGVNLKEARRLVDSEAAVIILTDFLDRLDQTQNPDR